jgi:hypothetical protein
MLAMQENREYMLSWKRYRFIVLGIGTVFRCIDIESIELRWVGSRKKRIKRMQVEQWEGSSHL